MPTLLTINRIIQNGQQWRYGEKFIVTQTLTDPTYFIDGYDANKFDFILTTDVVFTCINIKEGVKYIFTVENDVGATVPVLLDFTSSSNTIRWKGGQIPKVVTNGVITLFNSDGIIYAEFKDGYVDSTIVEAPNVLTVGTHEINKPGVYYIDTSGGDVTATIHNSLLFDKIATFKIIDSTNNFYIEGNLGTELFEGEATPHNTGLVKYESIDVTSDLTDLHIID